MGGPNCSSATAAVGSYTGDTGEGSTMDLTKDLEIARDTVVASLDGLDDAQWRFRPAPECWSIAEIAEHVTLVSREIGLMVRGPLLQAPVDEDHPAGEGLVRSRLL